MVTKLTHYDRPIQKEDVSVEEIPKNDAKLTRAYAFRGLPVIFAPSNESGEG
jgi:hypothetical protein